MKEKKKKIIINLLIFVVLMLLLFYFIFKNMDFKELVVLLKESNLKYIFLGIAIMASSFLCEAINFHICLKSFGYNTSLLKCLKYSSVGFFFSGITPSSTGGQPMQVYYMHKDKIPISVSTILLVLILAGYIVATLLLAISGLFVDSGVITSIGHISFFVYFGIFINIAGFILCMILMFSKKLAVKISNFLVKILSKFKYKKIDQFKEKINDEINLYQSTAEHIKNNKWILILSIFLNLLQLVAKFSIPYCVYRGFGLNKYGYIYLLLLESILFVSTSIMPFPGAMGVSEGAFLILFKEIFTEKNLPSAMLINRVINFYLFIFITGIIIFVDKIINMSKKSKTK